MLQSNRRILKNWRIRVAPRKIIRRELTRNGLLFIVSRRQIEDLYLKSYLKFKSETIVHW